MFPLSRYRASRQSCRCVLRIAKERIGNELGRQLRIIEVTTSKAAASDVDLSRHANGYWVQVRVQQIDLGICNRASDGNGMRALRHSIDPPRIRLSCRLLLPARRR